jgi:hypothetical protein
MRLHRARLPEGLAPVARRVFGVTSLLSEAVCHRPMGDRRACLAGRSAAPGDGRHPRPRSGGQKSDRRMLHRTQRANREPGQISCRNLQASDQQCHARLASPRKAAANSCRNTRMPGPFDGPPELRAVIEVGSTFEEPRPPAPASHRPPPWTTGLTHPCARLGFPAGSGYEAPGSRHRRFTSARRRLPAMRRSTEPQVRRVARRSGGGGRSASAAWFARRAHAASGSGAAAGTVRQ